MSLERDLAASRAECERLRGMVERLLKSWPERNSAGIYKFERDDGAIVWCVWGMNHAEYPTKRSAVLAMIGEGDDGGK